MLLGTITGVLNTYSFQSASVQTGEIALQYFESWQISADNRQLDFQLLLLWNMQLA